MQGKQRSRGFRQAGSLVEKRIRAAGEGRGFAVSRLLTRWTEVAGPDLAPLCQPVKVSYGRSGLGATLTVLTTGAQAPLVEMAKETLRTRVNACYGYNAIAKVRITQTAGTLLQAPKADDTPQPAPVDPAAAARAHDMTEGLGDSDLRAALEELGRTVCARRPTTEGV